MRSLKQPRNLRLPDDHELGGCAQKIGLLVEQIKVTGSLSHKSFSLCTGTLGAKNRNEALGRAVALGVLR